jgi:3-oxoadipate enol-lactonase
MTAIRERTIETNRGRSAWLEAGAGWPAILLHAFPLNATMWRAQLEHVPEGWRFIAPDLRGFGRGADATGAVTMDDYAADVFALMDALEIDDAWIGGSSMGGYVTFAMQRLAPARFTGMLLANTRSIADTPQAREGRMQMRARLADKGPPAVADQVLPNLLSSTADPDTVALVRQTIESTSSTGIDAAIGALMERPDSTPDLARVTCAALVIASDGDAIVPVAEAEAMQRALRRSRLTMIPDAGHLSNLEQPAAFSRALEDFLRSAL